MLNTKINLCDNCLNNCNIPTCIPDNVILGDGVGDDNIIECCNYEEKKWNGLLSPNTFINLIGKRVVQQNYKTGEKWKPQILLKIEITKDGVFAVLNEELEFRINMMEFDIYEE